MTVQSSVTALGLGMWLFSDRAPLFTCGTLLLWLKHLSRFVCVGVHTDFMDILTSGSRRNTESREKKNMLFTKRFFVWYMKQWSPKNNQDFLRVFFFNTGNFKDDFRTFCSCKESRPAHPGTPLRAHWNTTLQYWHWYIYNHALPSLLSSTPEEIINIIYSFS